MNELWSRSVASVYDGKVEDFKRLAGDLVSTIRENGCDCGRRSMARRRLSRSNSPRPDPSVMP